MIKNILKGMVIGVANIIPGVSGGTMHAVNATIQGKKPVMVVKFKDVRVNGHEKCKGNDYLVEKKGAWYVSGSDNLDVIARNIMSNANTPQKLF